MKNLIIPADYHSPLNLHDTQIAIKTVKDFFQNLLAQRLNLARVSAPLFVDPATGLNDNLNGVERPVSFGIKEQNEKRAEVVHSLAKWKRYALQKYGFCEGEGIYTDMNAIRRDEDTDNIHSIFVDQWDWEKIIRKEDRTPDVLKETVRSVYKCLRKTENICPFSMTISKKSFLMIFSLSQQKSWNASFPTFLRKNVSIGFPRKKAPYVFCRSATC